MPDRDPDPAAVEALAEVLEEHSNRNSPWANALTYDGPAPVEGRVLLDGDEWEVLPKWHKRNGDQTLLARYLRPVAAAPAAPDGDRCATCGGGGRNAPFAACDDPFHAAAPDDEAEEQRKPVGCRKHIHPDPRCPACYIASHIKPPSRPAAPDPEGEQP